MTEARYTSLPERHPSSKVRLLKACFRGFAPRLDVSMNQVGADPTSRCNHPAGAPRPDRASPAHGRSSIRSASARGHRHLTSAFIGMVLALQTAYALADFGGKMFVGTIVSLSLVRELAPVLMSLMVGGRVGAGRTPRSGR